MKARRRASQPFLRFTRAGALGLCLLLAACGYRLGAVKPVAFEHVGKIYVPTFKRDILEPRSAVMVTNAVIQRLQRDGTYRVATAEQADAILDATITELDRRQARSTRFNTLRTSELEFTLRIDYQFRDLHTNEVLDEGSVLGKTSQFVDPNFQLSERQALALAAEKAADQLVSRLSEGW